MTEVKLGNTGIVAGKHGFGALPIQRISDAEAVNLVQAAYEGGFRFFDTARFYTDSEHKLGLAFAGMRDKVYIASKTMCKTTDEFWQQLETTLKELNSDYLDLYQFHNPAFCPKPDGEDGLYAAMLAAKEQGMVRHIGITNHRWQVAEEAIASGLYETLQYPCSYLSNDKDLEVMQKCGEAGMGFLAMKGMAGGLITNARAAAAFLAQFPHVLPLWGIQRHSELQDFLGCIENPPQLDADMLDFIEREKQELAGDFCRGCGYCMPCPMDIKINDCARMSLMVRRAPQGIYLNETWQAEMAKVEDCIRCGACSSRCPYGLDTPDLLARNLADYKTFFK